MNTPTATPIIGTAHRPAAGADGVGGVELGCDVRRLGDDELLVHAAEIERLGRVVDAARVAAAAEIAERSRKELGTDGFAAKKGCRNPVELIERVTRVSAATAVRRIRLGAATRRQPTLCGFDMPARYPEVAAALAAGVLGVDAASAIVNGLNPVLGHSVIDAFVAAEAALVAAAIGTGQDAGDDTATDTGVDDGTDSAAGAPLPLSADEVRIQTLAWRAFLDPDGIRPEEDRAMAARGLRLGAARGGIVPISGSLLPEIAGKLQRVFDAYLSPRTTPAFLSADEHDGASRTARTEVREDRTADQQRHDILAVLIDTAARAVDTPTIGGAAPTVLVTVRQQDLAQRSGAGFIDGVEHPVSIETVEQFACAGGTQKAVLDQKGRVAALGSKERCFTPKQRRAIMARDGGCLIPGCGIPAGWCEIHHVTPHNRGGPTHTDNGALLCWFHHRTIDTAGWGVRMIGGAPQIKAPPWLSLDDTWRAATKARTNIPTA
jgi:Domain of unknown function DUF222.